MDSTGRNYTVGFRSPILICPLDVDEDIAFSPVAEATRLRELCRQEGCIEDERCWEALTNS